MLKTEVDFWSELGRKKGHTHVIVVFDADLRREYHRFVADGESVDTTVSEIRIDPSQQIVKVVQLT